ncbi:hypothetical protein SAMN06265365_1882 [Tistlia consotensis]|uniref:hypothetical protein n=1 Tax=Tistlia consotensis TaxID=1321365 RepID=UPI000B6D4468|nr:hypothetical protein [Tistlia consotensis]SNS43826.1 hypothetical protein SAMN06265365_1882 [Tistlia consotensis]
MSKARRKRARTAAGTAIDTAPLLASDPELARLDAALTEGGYTRAATVRPVVNAKGLVTFRFVWRKRRAGITETHERIYRFPLSDLEEARP